MERRKVSTSKDDGGEVEQKQVSDNEDKEPENTLDLENELDQRETVKAIRESIAGLHTKFDALASWQEKCTMDVAQNYDNSVVNTGQGPCL